MNVSGTIGQQFPGFLLECIGRFGGVPLFYPCRIVIVVISAGYEIAVALGKPERLAGVPARQDGAPVFNRNTEHPRASAVMDHQLISKGGGRQVARRNPLVCFGRFSDDVVAFILCIVNESTGFLINPIVGDDAVPGGICAGRQGRVAHGGFSVGVPVMGIDVPSALFHQIAESPIGETIGVTPGQITTQLIHGDLQHQTRGIGSCRCKCDPRQKR